MAFAQNPNECEFVYAVQADVEPDKPGLPRDLDNMMADLLHLEDFPNDSSDNEPGTSDDGDIPPKDEGGNSSEEDNGELNQREMQKLQEEILNAIKDH